MGSRLRLVCRLSGSYPETGFEEMRRQASFGEATFPPTGLLARNNFRLARDSTRIKTSQFRSSGQGLIQSSYGPFTANYLSVTVICAKGSFLISVPPSLRVQSALLLRNRSIAQTFPSLVSFFDAIILLFQNHHLLGGHMLHRVFALACCLLLFTFLAFADEPMAPLQGYIFADGKPLADATVVLLNESGEMTPNTTEFPTESRFVASAATDVKGSFLFFDVPKSRLGLHVSKPGFQPSERYVEFTGSPLTLHIDLARGEVAFGKSPAIRVGEETIYYVTDRKPSGSVGPETFFTNERSFDGMHYGTAVVSVPSDSPAHEVSTEYALALRGDRLLNVVLASVKDESKSAFFSHLGKEGEGKDALVFIHGYSNSFEYAARRLGALKNDLNFPGPAILYSWASRNSLSAYADDEATADWSSPHFQQFLQDLFRTGVRRVHLVAHSMGNRILLRGMQACSAQRLGEVVFAAPDVDADTFREALPVVSKFVDRLTEYASDKDRALWFSGLKHGLPRAGQLQAAIRNTAGDVVDATRVDTSLEHHSYFVDSPQVVSDIALVIRGRVPPRPRLFQMQQGQVSYWQLQP